MREYRNLEAGAIEFLFPENLSPLNCLSIIKQASRRGFKVERLECWTAKGDYFQIHDYERFCPDYLVDLEGWEFRAYEQLMLTYGREMLKSDPTNYPCLNLMITKSWLNPERARFVAQEVEMLRGDPTYAPKYFEAYDAPVGIFIN